MSYANLANSLQAGPGISITPDEGTGTSTVIISTVGTNTGNTVLNVSTFPYSLIGVEANVILVRKPKGVSAEIELPASVPGNQYTLKDADGHASIEYPIYILAALPGKIDGENEASITVPYGSITLVGDGADWHIT